MNFSKTLLLTGAGFSANFGGFLAREMWSWIFNNNKLNNAGNIKLKLRDEFDFEKIYSDVFDERSNFPEHEIGIFKEVVNEAYVSMDHVIQAFWDSMPIHPNDLERFLDRFMNPPEGGIGTCFTLNQDMVMEKRLGWRPLCPQSMNFGGNWGDRQHPDLNSDSPKILPTSDEFNTFIGQQLNISSCYIKLHGSLRWVNPGGEDSKVIGINKVQTIKKIPLLNWYYELFGQAISVGDVKLVVIGYGFRDDHINSLLAKACEESGLKLFVLSPDDPESFQENLLYRGQSIARSPDIIGNKIWKGVHGYFPYRLSKMFPREQRNINPELNAIYASINV